MPIAVQCPNAVCGKSFRVQDAAAGRKGKCPICATWLVIPAPAPAVAAPPDPVSAPAAPDAAAAGVVRFEAIGEAWCLFRQRAGGWILATLLAAAGGMVVQFGLFLLSIPVSIVGGVVLGGALAPLMGLGSLAVAMAVWGLLLGGMFRMALNQVDGEPVAVKDLVPGVEVLPGLALASLLGVWRPPLRPRSC
jgi:hypothetical protein